jgi:serine protease AprX
MAAALMAPALAGSGMFTAAPAVAGAPLGAAGGGGAGWASGSWQGSGTTATGTPMRDVRTIINAASGTAGTLNGTGVGIAMIDTGVAPVAGLPAAQIVNGPDLSFESQASNLRYLDTYGHGTHLAGIILGNESASGTVGLAPKAKLTSVKVGTANGAVDVSQIIAAIDWVVANRNHDPSNPIRVLNLSYGTGGNPNYWSDPVQFAVEQAWLAGIVVVVSAGNDGNTAAMTNPATDPFVIAVGASSSEGTLATSDDALSTFSSVSFQSRTVDLLAPGEAILSLRDQGSNIDETYPGARQGTTLFRGSGSSQAAAVTSAAAALLLQNRPGLTPDQVKKLLVDSGTPMQVGVAATKNLRQINVGAAVARATPTTSQTWTKSVGTGSLEAARGDSHVVLDNVALSGERSIFGPFSSTAWAASAAQRRTWSGGVWMGSRIAGDNWTGPGGSVATGQISGWAGRCVDLTYGITTNGTAVQLFDCNNSIAQYWTMQSDGALRVMGKCLNVRGGGSANGTPVEIWDCNGSAAQVWVANADRELVNPATGNCLDVPDFSNVNGVDLKTWDCNGGLNQKWMPPFASKTWGAASWSGTPWSGAATWVDPDWSGRYWSGRYWSGRYWSGRYWSSDEWSSARWG